MENDRTDLGQWQPRDRDTCPHCGHDWHGLPCTMGGGCWCLGAHVLGQQPPPPTGKIIVKKEQT